MNPSKVGERTLARYLYNPDLPDVDWERLRELSEYWEAVRRQAPADVVMPGFATRPEDWLAAFDCFVSPARNEPFGLVLLEAMQAGLPVVATASEGAKHLAQMIGRPLVPIDDAPALAGALGQVHREGPRRQTYALEGYRVANKAREVDRFYESLLAQRRS